MRVIDADELKTMAAAALEIIRKIPGWEDQEKHIIAATHMVMGMIDDCPTVDVIPTEAIKKQAEELTRRGLILPAMSLETLIDQWKYKN